MKELQNDSVKVSADNALDNPIQNSIILADKPLDHTSADIVRIFKKEFSLRKIGHSGTLDPKATGLLVLCTGKLTKKIAEFIDYDKAYEGVIRIGAVTKSFDTESQEEDHKDVSNVTEAMLEETAKYFRGEILQTPPMYSALKHKGKPLYKLARKGREIKREPRKILVSEFNVYRVSESEVRFNISASKGAYIRCIANDFGQALGTGGYLKELRRTRVGKFELKGFESKVRDISYEIIYSLENPETSAN